MTDNKEKYDRISKSIFLQIELLLNHIDDNLKGETITVAFKDERQSYIGNFLRSESLLINIDLSKSYFDDEYNITFTVYRIFSDEEQYELAIYLNEKSRLYQLVPLKIRNALIASVETESDIEVTL